MTDGHASTGYGNRAPGFGQKPALGVIDLQRCSTDPAFPMGSAPMVKRPRREMLP